MTSGRLIRIGGRLLLAAAAAVALGFVLETAHVMRQQRPLVVNDTARWGEVSLQLAPTRRVAIEILRSWDHPVAPDRTDTARDGVRRLLDLDGPFIRRYSWFLLLFGWSLIAGYHRRVSRGLLAATAWLAVVLATAGFDTAENQAMRAVLGAHPHDLAIGVHDVALRTMRLAAQLKFLLLLGQALFLLTAATMVFRRWWDPESLPGATPPIAATAVDAIEAMTHDEASTLELGAADRPQYDVGPSGEPWIRFRSADVLGLALSGGGIRSATFGLGVLQGLDYLGVLKHVHYLSTVSGGGYIGGFWSAWRLRHETDWRQQARAIRAEAPIRFPRREVVQDSTTLTEPGDPEEVRHLREFSRFLSPRIGFFETEMWHAVIAFLGGLLPSLGGTLALLFLGLVVWLALNFPLACPDPWAGVTMLVVLTAAVCVALETSWWTYAAPETRDRSRRLNLAVTAAALGVLGVLQAWLPTAVHAVTGRWYPLLDTQWRWIEASGETWPAVGAAHVAWWHGMFGVPGLDALYVSLRLFDYPIVWLIAAGLGLAARLVALMLLLGRGKGVFLTAFDRLLMRLVGLALVWAGAALLWHIGVNLDKDEAWTAAGGALATGGSFAMLRRWMGTVLRQTPKRSVLARVRPYVPQILAYLTIGLVVCVLVRLAVSGLGHDWMRWYIATGLCAAVVVGMLHLDPAEYSLHAFYRDRICRAYVGASNDAAHGRADQNRAAEFRPGDDVLLSALPPERPLHLVCCAANDLSGDQVATLARGAKSATLSRYGVAIGGYQAAAPRMSLGTALTASAAAFNSTMGAVSKRLGPAVTFLMAAMNLRLGVWVPHPAVRTPRRRLFPGLLFYKELFGLTDATPVSKDAARTDVHLSDGGHFENLAMYELVRRHCRYIVVVDAGEDLDVAFDDFGNAARRIREDFGVEIEIDLAPLAPGADRCARQHVAVGTIHYDRRYDKGILVYLKPTLTGDEPPDVRQYQRRNTAFPHEPTTDQFYDEAQWESYRRLGVHTALSAFRFVERLPTRHKGEEVAADRIFTGIRQEWWPTPPELPAHVLDATQRLTTLEGEILERQAESLLAEIFPEIGATTPPDARRRPTPEDQVRIAATVVEATQVLEDIWLSCDLETQWNHPLNLGWINAFARWTSAPTFRAWWPVVSPMFSPAFQRFMRERFPALERSTRGILKGCGHDMPAGLATAWWMQPMSRPIEPGDRHVFEYSTLLPLPGGEPVEVQMGVMLLYLSDLRTAHARATWTSEEFFVPPSLWGAGVGGMFLRGLLDALATVGVRTCDVFVVNRRYEISRNQRTERIGYLEFYRGFGFQVVAKGFGEQASPALCAMVQRSSGGRDAEVDAWVQLRWTAPRQPVLAVPSAVHAGQPAPETPEN